MAGSAVLLLASCAKAPPPSTDSGAPPVPPIGTATTTAATPARRAGPNVHFRTVVSGLGKKAECIDARIVVSRPVAGVDWAATASLAAESFAATMFDAQKTQSICQPCRDQFEQAFVGRCAVPPSDVADAGESAVLTLDAYYYDSAPLRIDDARVKRCLARGGTWTPKQPP